MHLVFYDGDCGLCDHLVQFLLRVDDQEQFVFAPLQGTTAAAVLKDAPASLMREDSLILVENFRSSIPKMVVLGKGALRICWLLGGWWTLLGWLSFLPGFLYNWAYRLVARNRHRFFKKEVCILPDQASQDRFLP